MEKKEHSGLNGLIPFWSLSAKLMLHKHVLLILGCIATGDGSSQTQPTVVLLQGSARLDTSKWHFLFLLLVKKR
uniref:Secreted protein n=1 Tax=Steinernema glaseri TaxID=37863 RepID=A0A1I7XZ62_9BILA